MNATLNPSEEVDLQRRIRKEADALAIEFAGMFGAETIARYIDESAAAFRDGPSRFESPGGGKRRFRPGVGGRV